MRWIGRFLALPRRERWLLIKTWALLLVVRIALSLGRYGRTRRFLERIHRRPVPRLVRQGTRPERLASLTEAASHFVPSGRHCLTRAMALETMLRRRGHDARVVFGVARGRAREIEAHAWVVCDDQVLLGGDGLERFTSLSPPPARTGFDG